jgi:tetratricopeptide (TPR) repeat protein
MESRRIAYPLLVVGLLLALNACSRKEIEAVEMANEGDQMAKTNPAGAISKYEQATKVDPNNHRIYYKLAVANEKMEKWDHVKAAATRAAQLEKDNAKYWYKVGKANVQLAQTKPEYWEQARVPLENCIKSDPNFDDCYFELGEVMLHMDEEQRALENWTKAIKHNPQELLYYTPLAQLYLSLNYNAQAEQVLKEGFKFATPTSAGVSNLHQLMSQVYQAKGDTAKMVSELELARDTDKQRLHPEILFNLGSAYAVMTPPKKEDARKMLDAFRKRGCVGSRKKAYQAQCEQTDSLLSKLTTQ